MNNKILNENFYGTYRTPTFSEVFTSQTDFKNFYDTNGVFPNNTLQTTSVNIIYGLLYARYGNTPIAANDVNRFMVSVMGIVFQYGPTWEKQLEIQSKLRGLTEDELREGALAKYGNGQFSGKSLSLDDITTTEGINNYSGQKFTKGMVDSYAELASLLRADYTNDFVAKFKGLFINVFVPSDDLSYETYNYNF